MFNKGFAKSTQWAYQGAGWVSSFSSLFTLLHTSLTSTQRGSAEAVRRLECSWRRQQAEGDQQETRDPGRRRAADGIETRTTQPCWRQTQEAQMVSVKGPSRVRFKHITVV